MQKPFQLTPEMQRELEGALDAQESTDPNAALRYSTSPAGISRRDVYSQDSARSASGGDDNLADAEANAHDPVNHPAHYTGHPSGVECIQIVEWMNFCLGNAIKYIWRAGQKTNTIEDLRKARWYLDREITRLESLQ